MIGSQVNVGGAPNSFRFFFSGSPPASSSSLSEFLVFAFAPVSRKGAFGLTHVSGFLAGMSETTPESESAAGALDRGIG